MGWSLFKEPSGRELSPKKNRGRTDFHHFSGKQKGAFLFPSMSQTRGFSAVIVDALPRSVAVEDQVAEEGSAAQGVRRSGRESTRNGMSWTRRGVGRG